MTSTETLRLALSHITDPLNGQAITASRISGLRMVTGVVRGMVDVTGLSVNQRDTLEATLKAALADAPDVKEVRLALTSNRHSQRIIAVASGKGGVGKSTVSANLAIALARMGHKVGVVDADVYGPSQPTLFGVEAVKPEAEGQKLIPVPTAYGVRILSMGQLVKPGQALAWRGPMASNALGQLLDGDWRDTDIIIVDMPPGTGDIQLSMIQKHKPAGAVIVSTPQDLALIDATRAIDLFQQASVPIIGLVENMAGYLCPHCNEISDPFGRGGAELSAQQRGHAFLGRIPLEMAIRQSSDAGQPVAAGSNADSAAPFVALAAKVDTWLGAH